MVLTSKEKSQRYRERKIAALGIDEFRRQETEKRRARREKKVNRIIPPDTKLPPTIGTSQTELKRIVKDLNVYLNKDYKIDVPTVVKIIESKVLPNLIKMDSKDCSALKQAVFASKSKHLKRFTQKSNTTQFNKIAVLYKHMKSEPFKCTTAQFDVFKDTKTVLNVIATNPKWKPNTRNTFLQSLAGVLKYLDGYQEAYGIYSKTSIEGRKAITATDGESTLTESERKNWMSWGELKKVSKSDKLNDYEKALTGLYTLVPPRRLELAQYLTLATPDTKITQDRNWLVVDAKSAPIKITMYKYKTAHKYGEYEMKLPAALKKLLKGHIVNNKIEPGQPVFGQRGRIKYYKDFSGVLSRIFKKATGKTVTANILRHAKISDFIKRPKSTNAKRFLAYAMGHTISTQEKYNRIDVPR